jgi:hypothetical protein
MDSALNYRSPRKPTMKRIRGWLLIYVIMTFVSAVAYLTGLIIEAPDIMKLPESLSGRILYFSIFTVCSTVIKLGWSVVILYCFLRQLVSTRSVVIAFELFCILIRLAGPLFVANGPFHWSMVMSLGIAGISLAWILYFARSVTAKEAFISTGN